MPIDVGSCETLNYNKTSVLITISVLSSPTAIQRIFNEVWDTSGQFSSMTLNDARWTILGLYAKAFICDNYNLVQQLVQLL